MISSFLNVGSQVVVLFILIGVGVVLTKLKILSQSGVSSITNLILYVVSPCLIINAFLREYDSAMMKSLLTALIASIGIMTLSVVIAKLLFGKVDENRGVILKFAVVFSNCGFMSIPLQQALQTPHTCQSTHSSHRQRLQQGSVLCHQCRSVP